jgi:leucyl aminopeptidase
MMNQLLRVPHMLLMTPYIVLMPLSAVAAAVDPHPQAVVDIATLTGACIIALGGEVAGLFTPSDAMADSLAVASKAVGEKVWRMPMEASYAEQLKSSVADMKNTGAGRAQAGSCLVMWEGLKQ